MEYAELPTLCYEIKCDGPIGCNKLEEAVARVAQRHQLIPKITRRTETKNVTLLGFTVDGRSRKFYDELQKEVGRFGCRVIST